MDKKTILAFVLIGIVMIGWMLYSSTSQKPAPKPVTETVSDSTSGSAVTKDQNAKKAEPAKEKAEPVDSVSLAVKDSAQRVDSFGKEFAPFAQGKQDIIHIETDLVKIKINTKGATILEWELKNYKHWAGYPTQLIFNDVGELFLTWETRDRAKIDSRDLYFNFDNAGVLNYTLKGTDSLVLNAKIEIAPGKYVAKHFKFFGDKYWFVNDIEINNLEDVVTSRGFKYCWADGLRYQEQNSVDESGEAQAIVSMNGSTDDLNADESHVTKQSTGKIDFAGLKNKYFTAAIIPQPAKSFDGTVNLSGTKQILDNHGILERYGIEFMLPYSKPGKLENSFKVYIGPLDYENTSEVGITAMMNFGWKLIVRPIGEYFMLPIFKMLHLFIDNYGVVLMLFALIIKLLLYPLSIPQLRSTQKMKLINPMVAQVREKYKDDNTKQQQEVMKLYSEYGINPAGGCLPLLLQMPILYALWSVLRTNIELRQTEFVSWLWIHDLSIPDVLVTLPFRIPIFAVDKFSGLALLMGITMFIQQKMTVTDPKQKAMVWMMPVMFTLMFSSFPAGMNLYYFMFNILSIAQQIYLEKFSSNKLTLEKLKATPKKEGWFQKKMREAQEIAQAQGRTIPGQNKIEGNTSKTKYQRGRNKGGK